MSNAKRFEKSISNFLEPARRKFEKFEYGSREKTRTFKSLNIKYLCIYLYIYLRVRENTLLMAISRRLNRFTPLYPYLEPRTSNLLSA
jgi:hypothetical protein